MYNCFTEGQLLFGITSIDCTGSENHILNCTHNGPVLYNCESHNDAGVICQGKAVLCFINNFLFLYRNCGSI